MEPGSSPGRLGGGDLSLKTATANDEIDWITGSIGSELRRLAHDLFGLEHAIGDWAHAAGLDDTAIRDLQAADLIGQTLQELAGFLERYRAAQADGDPDPVQAALAEVRLGALRQRLTVQGAEAARPAAAAATHADIELF